MSLSQELQAIQNRLDELVRQNDELRHDNAALRREKPQLKMAYKVQKNSAYGKLAQQKHEGAFYKVGQRFRYFNESSVLDPRVYLLAQIDAGELNLIGLEEGNRWTRSFITANGSQISKKDFDAHFNGPNAVCWVLQP